MAVDGAIAPIAVRQHGLIARRQALAIGLSTRQIEVRLASGRWENVRRAVYRIAGTPPTERQAMLAAILAIGEDAAISHLSAGRLWGLELPAPAAIEVIGTSDRRVVQPGVRHHRSGSLAVEDLVSIGAIPVTSAARTLIDSAGSVPADRLGAVVDDALRRGLVRLGALHACRERVDTGSGRRSTVAMREVLAARAPGYEAGDSQREADLVRLLAGSGLPAPVLGHRVRIGRHTYKLDLAWPEWLAALEFDGWDTHRTFTAFHGDRQRLRRLAAAGWRIIPVTARTDPHELIGDVFRLVDLCGEKTTA